MSDQLQEEEEMGQWRRTNYSSEINSSLSDSEVIIMGWVSHVRDHGNIKFIMLRDRYGDIQVIAKKNECSQRLFEQLQQIKEHSSLAIRGRVRSQEKAPNGAEIIPLEIKIFSISKKPAPFMIQSKTLSVGIDTRLDLRAIDLRRNIFQSIFHIRHTILNAVRQFLVKREFIEVNTPKMIATATEGGEHYFQYFTMIEKHFWHKALNYTRNN